LEAEAGADANPLAKFAVANNHAASVQESQATSAVNEPQSQQADQPGAKFSNPTSAKNISQAQTQAPKPLKANPFQKQTTQDEKTLQHPTRTNKDIFNDLGVDRKRKNPFAAGNSVNGPTTSNAGK